MAVHRIVALGMFLMLVGSAAGGGCANRLPETLEGTIVRQEATNSIFWGLVVDFDWMRPLAVRQVRLEGLDSRFQREGLRVRCRCEPYDVVGTGPWDVVLRARSIDTIR